MYFLLIKHANEPRLARSVDEGSLLAVTLKSFVSQACQTQQSKCEVPPGEMALLSLIVMCPQINMLKLAKVSGESFVENKGRTMERDINLDRIFLTSFLTEGLVFCFYLH